jgi:S1-C subfamily serine protease
MEPGEVEGRVNEAAVNQQELLALVEKISSYSVGIAVERNTEIGTGTLIQDGNRRFILTAQHVIGDADPATIRFWSRPRAPLVDKPAREVTNAELQTLTAGQHLPMQSVHVDRQLDLAVMTLDPSYNLLRGSQFYNLSRSRTLSSAKLDGLSLLCFGFPTANARLIGRTTDGER